MYDHSIEKDTWDEAGNWQSNTLEGGKSYLLRVRAANLKKVSDTEVLEIMLDDEDGGGSAQLDFWMNNKKSVGPLKQFLKSLGITFNTFGDFRNGYKQIEGYTFAAFLQYNGKNDDGTVKWPAVTDIKDVKEPKDDIPF